MTRAELLHHVLSWTLLRADGGLTAGMMLGRSHSSRGGTAPPRSLSFLRNQQTPHRFFDRDDQASLEAKEDSMTDPRYTDPWYSDPPPDTGLPQGDSISGPLGWIVGI